MPAIPVSQQVLADTMGAFTDWVTVTSPDGSEVVVTGGRDGTLRLWDPATGQQVRPPVMASHTAETGTKAVGQLVAVTSGRGPLIAVRSEDERAYGVEISPIRVWDLANGELVGEIQPPTEEEYALTAVSSPDGRRLLGVTVDGADRTWCFDPLTGEPAGGSPVASGQAAPTPAVELPAGIPRPVTAAFRNLLAVPTGGEGSAVLAHRDGEDGLSAWDPTTGARIGTLSLTGDTPDALVGVSHPGGMLLAGCHGGEVTLWDVVCGDVVSGPIAAHPHRVTALCPVRLPDERALLASAGQTRSSGYGPLPDLVKLWDLTTGEAVDTPFTCHARTLAAVPAPEGGDWLACATDEGPVRIFDPTTGAESGTSFEPSFPVTRLAVLRGVEGQVWLAAAGHDEPDVEVWNPLTGESVAAVSSVYPLALAAYHRQDGGDALVTTDGNGVVELWDPSAGESLTGPLSGHVRTDPEGDRVVPLVLVDADGQQVLVTGGQDGTLRRWNLPGV